MQVDVAVAAQGVEVGGAAVVLVDDAGRAVADDERGVTAGTVGDARLDVDRDGQPVEVEIVGVGGADQVREAEFAHPSLELAGRVARQQDADVAPQVGPQPGLVAVVAVEVRDVQEVGVLDARQEVVGEAVVAGEREPRAEERRHEPGVTDDGPAVGLDQDPGVAERGGAHRAAAGRASGDGRVGVLLSGARDVLGPR